MGTVSLGVYAGFESGSVFSGRHDGSERRIRQDETWAMKSVGMARLGKTELRWTDNSHPPSELTFFQTVHLRPYDADVHKLAFCSGHPDMPARLRTAHPEVQNVLRQAD